MGILDDAIRQHLELKRRLGADDDELKQLEDEAFGPPTRPGEPDFPEAEADVAEAPDEPAEEPVAEDATADHALEDEPSDEEPVVTEHAVLAPEAVEGDDEEAQEAGGLFDQSPDQEFDLSDLDLDLEDDEEDELPLPAAAAPAIETLETEEHALEELEDQDVEDEDVEEEPSAEPEDQAGDEDDGEDEDVLADTPEFLRDAPEDDELWFEQGKPKDFDFDD